MTRPSCALALCVLLLFLAACPLPLAASELSATAQPEKAERQKPENKTQNTAQKDVAASIEEYGVFTATLDETSGQASEASLLEATATIPNTPGTVFGIRYQIVGPGKQPVVLDITLKHPPLTDPETGKTLDAYTLQREVLPGRDYVQLQRLPEDAPAGAYRFILQRQGKELATQTFTLAEQEGQSGEFALLRGELQARCRSLTPDLGLQFDNASLQSGHTFALRLPPAAGLPASGEVCFLALGDDNAAGLALSDMQGRLLAPIQPLEPGLQILAVSFALLDKDQLPEIVVVARNTAWDPPLHDSRVYFAVARDNSPPAWGRRPALDAKVARMQSAGAIRRWLDEHKEDIATAPANAPANASATAPANAPATGKKPAHTQNKTPAKPAPAGGASQ